MLFFHGRYCINCSQRRLKKCINFLESRNYSYLWLKWGVQPKRFAKNADCVLANKLSCIFLAHFSLQNRLEEMHLWNLMYYFLFTTLPTSSFLVFRVFFWIWSNFHEKYSRNGYICFIEVRFKTRIQGIPPKNFLNLLIFLWKRPLQLDGCHRTQDQVPYKFIYSCILVYEDYMEVARSKMSVGGGTRCRLWRSFHHF